MNSTDPAAAPPDEAQAVDRALADALQGAPPAPEAPPEDGLRRFLGNLGRALTEPPALAELSAAYGRERAVEDLLHWFGRVQVPQVLVVGPPKVGKTAVVHGMARRIAAGDCPEALRGATVFELNPSQLVNELADQWRSQLPILFKDMAERGDLLLYLRDLPYSIGRGPQGGTMAANLAAMLAEQLPSSGLRCLIELRSNTLRRLNMQVPEFEQSFARLNVEPPADPGELRAIVDRVAADLSARQGLAIAPEACLAAIDLSERFNVAQAFPGKAIELLAEAVARRAEAWAGAPDTAPGPAPRVEASDVAGHLSEQTGLSRLLIDDSLPFDEEAVRAALGQWVIGQDPAVDAIVRAISLIRAHVNDPRRPLGVFLFLGPTGVGKTELSRALAAWLFGNEERLVRLNMGDYQNEWNAPIRLFGDNDPDEDLPTRRGQITNLVADEPFAVLLLDEFEKAAGTAILRFMQLFDEGVLINGDGETVNLRNTIIIATSNFGAAELNEDDDRRIGFVLPESRAREDQVRHALEQHFRPEFINRLDMVCFFKPLGIPSLHAIARRELGRLLEREGIRRRGLAVEVDEEVIEHIVERSYSPKYGARHLKRQIERSLAYPLAQVIVTERPAPGAVIRVFLAQDRVQAALLREEAPPAPVAEIQELDRRHRFSLSELDAGLEDVRARVDRLLAFHDQALRREQAAALMARMNEPGFWTDPARAEAELAELGHLTALVDRLDGLAEAVAALAGALELVREAGGGPMVGEAARQYRFLLTELPRAELEMLLVGPMDARDAILRLSSSPPGALAGSWPADLARCYLAWAARRGFETSVWDEQADAAGDPAALVIAVRGRGAYGLLKGEGGVHRLVQHREGGGRLSRHLRVEVLPEIDPESPEAPEPSALRVEVRTIKARGALLGRLRSQARAEHRPSATRVTLTNDRSLEESRALARRLLAALVAAQARPAEAPLGHADGESHWGAVVRSYCTYKSQYVRDTRTGHTETNIRRVLDGQLDPFIEAYLRAAAAAAAAEAALVEPELEDAPASPDDGLDQEPEPTPQP